MELTSVYPFFLCVAEVMTLKGYVERRELTNYLLQCFQIVVNALNESQDVDDENAAVTRRGGRGLAASMAPFSAWDDIRQARKGQLGRRGSNIGSKPYGTFDQRRRSMSAPSCVCAVARAMVCVCVSHVDSVIGWLQARERRVGEGAPRNR